MVNVFIALSYFSNFINCIEVSLNFDCNYSIILKSKVFSCSLFAATKVYYPLNRL